MLCPDSRQISTQLNAYRRQVKQHSPPASKQQMRQYVLEERRLSLQYGCRDLSNRCQGAVKLFWEACGGTTH